MFNLFKFFESSSGRRNSEAGLDIASARDQEEGALKARAKSPRAKRMFEALTLLTAVAASGFAGSEAVAQDAKSTENVALSQKEQLTAFGEDARSVARAARKEADGLKENDREASRIFADTYAMEFIRKFRFNGPESVYYTSQDALAIAAAAESLIESYKAVYAKAPFEYLKNATSGLAALAEQWKRAPKTTAKEVVVPPKVAPSAEPKVAETAPLKNTPITKERAAEAPSSGSVNEPAGKKEEQGPDLASVYKELYDEFMKFRQEFYQGGAKNERLSGYTNEELLRSVGELKSLGELIHAKASQLPDLNKIDLDEVGAGAPAKMIRQLCEAVSEIVAEQERRSKMEQESEEKTRQLKQVELEKEWLKKNGYKF